MAEITVTIDVPDGVNPDWIIARAKELPDEALSLIAQRGRINTENARIQLILSDDTALRADMIEHRVNPDVIVRAYVYKAHPQKKLLKDVSHIFGSDDRRPVYMHGSLQSIYSRYNDFHWIDKVARRHARACKITLLNWNETYKYLEGIEQRVFKKFKRIGLNRLSSHNSVHQLWQSGPRNCRDFGRNDLVWVSGREVSLPTGAIFYLLNLRALGEKAERLERYALKHAA